MAHTLDTSAQISNSVANPATASYTCAANATLLVVGIAVGASAARTGTAPTYNGVALLQAGTTQTQGPAGGSSCELWYMLAPPQGSSLTVSIPNTGTTNLQVVISSWISATGMSALDQSNGLSQATGANPSTSVTTTWPSGGNVTVDMIVENNTLTVGQTSLFSGTIGATGRTYGASYNLQGNATSTVAMSWTATSSKANQCVASFNEVNHNTMMMTGMLT